jgi:predicted nucleic acid-binding protein
MNGNNYLLDTNSIIYALNQEFVFPNNRYFVSIITEIELFSYSKLTLEEEHILKSALSYFTTININENIKKHTIEIRKYNKIKLPDSLIIATALDTNSILVTSDKQLLNSNLIKTIEIKDLRIK